ncbi:autoinducer binding domain-containing protein [Mitsuaria sp. WAJ17]|uniref:autoinducer binding domain-containing protein n=1 Tax=Mitsuaria sp. WAJ17 TaxID=2761452 RepID=UPI0016034015|nr:autoinducer binding domain-containing protein [Mitsuaria sp. WAJ17]MBB2484029.1 autoinducer binding domain-containing protein [Mitsuaria sp. WAJ17]
MRAFIEEANQADNVAALLEAFERAVGRLSFDHYSLSYWEAVAGTGSASAPEHRVLASNYPDHWVSRYLHRDYFRKDPVIRHARATATPYQWRDLQVDCQSELIVLEEARDAGLREGLSIPIHEPWGKVFLTTLASRRPDCSQVAATAQTRTQAQVMAVVFHS